MMRGEQRHWGLGEAAGGSGNRDADEDMWGRRGVYIDAEAATQGTWPGPWICGIIETDQIRRGCLPLEML